MHVATRLSLVSTIALSAGLSAVAQTPATPPLLPPAGLYYRYWPMQVVQWLGPELPYSMIVLYVDDRPKEPSYDVELLDRAGTKRTHYVNKPELAAEDKAKGDEAVVTRMQFDQPATPGKDAQYLLRFSTEKGVPVLWQFVQGTEIGEQGSGVNPVETPFPVIAFREQGALAGEGTALKIGSVTSTAEVWKEYARPPYFVPYHGAISQGVHILSMAPSATAWTDPQPAPLTEGAAWKLTASSGAAFNAHADSLKGPAMTVSFSNEARGTVLTLDAQQAGNGWAVSRVRLGPVSAKADHTLSLVFTPALASGADSRFDLVAGRKTKLASGSVHCGASEDGKITDTWTMTAPDWAKGKSAAASASLQR